MCVSFSDIWAYGTCPHNVKNILETSKYSIIYVNMKFWLQYVKIPSDRKCKMKKDCTDHLGRDSCSCIPRVCPLPQSHVSHTLGCQLKVKMPSTACLFTVLSLLTLLLFHLPTRLLLNQHGFPWVFPRSHSPLCCPASKLLLFHPPPTFSNHLVQFCPYNSVRFK